MGFSRIFRNRRIRKIAKAAAVQQQQQAQKATEAQAAAESAAAAATAAAAETQRVQQLDAKLAAKPMQTTAVAVDEPENLGTYINSMRNRRKKGAPLAANTGVLGQPTSLGV